MNPLSFYPTIDMGKNRNKSKVKVKKQDLSEADAAAGMMVRKPAKEVKQDSSTGTQKDKVDTSRDNSSKRDRDFENPSTADVLAESSPVKLSRKQKRQKLNEKNKWPQHPKIANPEQRAKAYLRVAGIEPLEDDSATEFKSSVSKSSQQQLGDDDEWRRFGRFLGGTDARTRHRAVKKLGQYLKIKSGFGLSTEEELDAVSGLSEMDWMKLWKGLWYTLYMADKVPVQDELAKHLSKLIWCVAGTLEEDEFAGNAVIAMDAEEEQKETDEDGVDDDDVKIFDSRFVEMEAEDDASDSGSDLKEDDDEDSSHESDEEKHAREEENSEEDQVSHEEGEEGDDMEVKHIRGAPLAMLMIRTFFRTLVREWGNMDKYRIDKFYTLVRYMLREVYRYMATRQWNLGIIRLLNDAIIEEALIKPPNGVRYHLIDVALDELLHIVSTINASDTLPMTEAIFLEVMEPFFVMTQHGFGDKNVQARVVESVLEKFLMQCSVVSPSGDKGEEDKNDSASQKHQVFDQVQVATVSRFIFELGGSDSTLDIHRKSLYDMHKMYERQIKKAGTDLDIDYQEEEGDDDAELHEDLEVKELDENTEAKGIARQEEAISDVGEKDEEEPLPLSPKNKKLKKKVQRESMDVTQHGRDSGKKAKKKKNSKNNESHDTEDVVTISVSDQRKAKKAMKEQQVVEVEGDEKDTTFSKKSKKKKQKSKEGNEDSHSRRVSFGTKNRARSYKASMQGLRKLDPKETIKKTPEKGILYKKGEKSPTNKHAKQRKRAVDYF